MKYAMTRQSKSVLSPAVCEVAGAESRAEIGESADSIAFDCWLFLPLLDGTAALANMTW
jgi:hypothetical protein